MRHVAARPARRLYTAPTAALNACVEAVRHGDKERYLCNLHAPADARAGLFALHAFNLETARIRATVSDESVGRMRFTWWRQAIEESLAGTPPEHPTAQALAHVHARVGLTPRYLEQILEAREADLTVRQPRDRAQLTIYCEHTAGSLLLLGLECLGAGGCDSAESAASQAGMALGLATLLRGMVAHVAQGCCYLPEEVTRRHRVDLASVLRGEPSAPLSDAVAEVADEAVSHMLAARSLRPELSAAARTALLPTTVADHILLRLQRHAYSPFTPAAHAPPGVGLQLALLFRRFSGTY